MAARFDAVGLVVSDMEASVSFYALLGLDFTDPTGSGRHLEAEGTGGSRVMLDTESVVAGFDATWSPPAPGPVRARLGVRCDATAEVDRLHAAAVERGHRSAVEPFDAFWGQRYASLLDPDGNPVDLFADLPEAHDLG